MRKLYKGEHAGEYTHALAPTPDKITRMGMARTFQNIRLWKDQTVFDNVLTAMHCRATCNLLTATFHLNRQEEARQRQRVEELLAEVNLSDVSGEKANSLPYGKQRRLEIARALATDPQLLLLDEPAAGMNPQETDELTAFIGEIRTKFGLTVFLIEHHMDLVMDISDRIYVLDFGKLIADGTPAEIQNSAGPAADLRGGRRKACTSGLRARGITNYTTYTKRTRTSNTQGAHGNTLQRQRFRIAVHRDGRSRPHAAAGARPQQDRGPLAGFAAGGVGWVGVARRYARG